MISLPASPLTRLATVVVATLALLAGFVPALADTATAQSTGHAEHIARDLHTRLNDERRARGIEGVGWDADLARAAATWSARMSATGNYQHSDMNATMATSPYRERFSYIGENIYLLYPHYESAGYAHRGWMRSESHRRNMLNAYHDAVGIGVVCDADGTMWATLNMGRHTGSARPAYQHSVPANPIVHDNAGGPTCRDHNATRARGPEQAPTRPLKPGEFRDVTGGAHAAAIKAIALKEVTNGCAPGRYCPNRQITRAQMAALISRARNLPATSNTYFTDVASSAHADAINALAAAGITGGCGGDRFCPNDPVSRGQMATFLQRAWSLPAPGGGLLGRSRDAFTDIASSDHRTAINAIAQADITNGCGANRYCPNNGVIRAEMASFLARTMKLV